MHLGGDLHISTLYPLSIGLLWGNHDGCPKKLLKKSWLHIYLKSFHAILINVDSKNNLVPEFLSVFFRENGPTASIFYGIWIVKSGAMISILNLDKVLLKKLFPTMNI